MTLGMSADQAPPRPSTAIPFCIEISSDTAPRTDKIKMRTHAYRDISKITRWMKRYPKLVQSYATSTCRRLLHSRDTGLLDSRVDLLVGSLLQGEEGPSDSSVVEDTSSYQSVFERDSTFHVGSSVVYRRSDREEGVVDLSGFGVVFGDTRIEEIEQELRGNTTVSHKHTVHVESRVEEVLVMACEDVRIRSSFSDDGDLSIPSSHVSNTVLHGEHTGLSEDIKLSLEIVCCLGVIGVLEENQRETGSFVDCFVSLLRRTRLVPKSKPSVAICQRPPIMICVWSTHDG